MSIDAQEMKALCLEFEAWMYRMTKFSALSSLHAAWASGYAESASQKLQLFADEQRLLTLLDAHE